LAGGRRSGQGRTLLLDLDGTLVDPRPGIVKGVAHALTSLGRPAPDPDGLDWVIGPSLRSTFKILLGDGSAEIEAAVDLYRAYYSDQGLTDAAVYPGIAEALTVLADGGARLLICTAKVRDFAVRVVEAFGLSGHFAGVYGAERGGRFDDKADLIAHILDAEGIAPADACMIGDRHHDITAARRNGVRSLGVLWGYGGETELREAGADGLCAAPGALPSAIEALWPGAPALA
jgi:phosphoglycolate phosphatase